MGQVYTVRAVPAQGHDRRWGAQRPFTKTPIDVTVVDNPKPHRMEDGKIVEYSYEVTAAELEELRKDGQLFVSVKGDPAADPLELNATKAKVLELEKQLVEAHKAHQEDVEQFKAFRIGAQKQAEESGAKVAVLQQELEAFKTAAAGKRKAG